MPLPAPSQALRPRNNPSKTKDGEPIRKVVHDDIEQDEMTSDQATIARPLHTRTLSFQTGTEGGKRRSFLPQPGVLKHNTSDLDNESEDSANQGSRPLAQPTSTASQLPSMQSSVTSRLRPRSMYQSSSTASEHRANSNRTVSTRHAQASDAVSKLSGPQSAGLRRSQSLRKTASSVPSAQATSTRVHSRTQSTNTIAARRDTTEAKAKLERPKSLLAAPSYTSKSSSIVSSEAVSDSTRTSTRLAALKRSTSTKNKPEALHSTFSNGPAARAEGPISSLVARRDATKEETKKVARPAFSTLQQHFTPRKIGKAPTSTFLYPAPDTSSHSLPSEIIQLQSELLQLHLLHESSAQVSRQWELNAKKRLRGKFDELVNLYHVMREYERSGQEQTNLQALLEWNGAKSSSGLVEHIQALSGPLDELPSLVESGGRLRRATDDFDRWVAWVEEVWTAREEGKGYEDNTGSIEGLGESWKSQMAALTRKLTSFLRDLGKLTQPAPGSSIACIVTACRELLGGILEELQMMQMIESVVVSKEKEWVEGRLRAIARDIGGSFVETNGEQAAWRMLRC